MSELVPTPTKGRVIAQRPEAITKTTSGILLEGSAVKKPNYANVVAVHEGSVISVGDKIVFKEFSQTDITVDGVEYMIISEGDVLATI